MIRSLHLLIACLIVGTSTLHAEEAAAIPHARVGHPFTIEEVYLPGPEIQPKPRRDRTPPIVVRITDLQPAKDGFRYDFEVQGLEPGEHNLADYLESTSTLPAIPIRITSELPPGLPRPHPLSDGKLPEVGGYRQTMILIASAWLVGLVGILLFRKKSTTHGNAHTTPPPTLAERLKPLVTRAAEGTLSDQERASLDRLIRGHWIARRPELAQSSPAQALQALREDPEASPLLLALEKWFHAPHPPSSPPALDSLLKPYTQSA